MAYFLIGCTHFGHSRVIDLANRPFASVEAIDYTPIRLEEAVERLIGGGE